MIWNEILLDKCYDDETLRAAVAEVCEVPPERVGIFRDLDELHPPREHSVILIRYPRYGDYPLQLSTDVFDEVEEGLGLGTNDAENTAIFEEFAKALCRTLDCDAVTPGAHPGPSQWDWISRDGKVRAVLMDHEGLDRDEIKIASFVETET